MLGHQIDRFLGSMLVFGSVTLLVVFGLGWAASGITAILPLSLITLCACDCALHYFYRVQTFSPERPRRAILSARCLFVGLMFAYIGAFVGGAIRDMYLFGRLPYAAGAIPVSFGLLGYSMGLLLSIFICAFSRFRETFQDAIADVDGFALGVFSVMGMELATGSQVFAGIEHPGQQVLLVLASSALTTVVGGFVRVALMFAPPINTAWIKNRTVLYYWLLGPCSGLLAYEVYIFFSGITLQVLNLLHAISNPGFHSAWSNDLVFLERQMSGTMFVFLYFLFGFGSAVVWLYIRERQKAHQLVEP
ncbi:MAG TPA: hypothetical protein VGO49_20180 [Bradyrhizobium sp.]|nr:hypothetical protein [Bradyrhizobium sp.]